MKNNLMACAAFGFAIGVGFVDVAGASNYIHGGSNQTYYFVPNMGGVTVTAIPTLENIATTTAGPLGTKPGHMIPDPKGEFMFSVNHGGNALSVYDAKKGNFIRHIKVGSDSSREGQGHQYYWSNNGRHLWVTDVESGALVEVDRNSLKVSRKLEHVASHPEGMALAEKEGYLYVLGKGEKGDGNKVAQVRISDFKKLRDIPVGKAPHVAIYAAGKVYVGNTAHGENSVSVIDAATGKRIKTIDVGFDNPHFMEDPVNGSSLLMVASVITPEFVLIDVKKDAVVGHFRADDIEVPAKRVRHPMFDAKGDSVYFPLGNKEGTSRIYQISIPDLKVISVSKSAPSMIHMMQWNKEKTHIYAATEGNNAEDIPPGVSVFKVHADGSLQKLADMFADVPAGEKKKGHHGSLN